MSGRPIKKATTNVSSVIRILDSTDGTPETGVTSATAGLALNYRREGEVANAITAINDLALLTTAHTDGGILHIGDGYYRVDFQDAAFATGSDGVLLTGTATGMVVIGAYHPLVDYDPYDSVRMGMTALPNAAADAAGGLPISDAGGLDLDTKLANTNEVTVARMGALTDWINGGRLDLLLDAIKAVTDALPDAGALTTLITHLTDIKGTGFVKDTHSLTDIEAFVDTVEADIAALNDIAAADVLTQVNTALDATISELAQVQPSATPSVRTGIMLAYMMIRNKLVTQTSGTDALEVYNDAGTLIAKKLLTDAAGDYTEAKMVAGP